MAWGPTMRPMGCPASSHSSKSRQMCDPATPNEMKRRSVIFFSFSSFSLVLIDPCGRGDVRGHPRERTRTDGTEPARQRPPEVGRVSIGRDGAVHPPWIPRNRPRAALAVFFFKQKTAY